MHEANNPENLPKVVERKRRKTGRVRLERMMYAIKRAIPQEMYRTRDSEAVAEGYNVCRPDVVDRVISDLEHRILAQSRLQRPDSPEETGAVR